MRKIIPVAVLVLLLFESAGFGRRGWSPANEGKSGRYVRSIGRVLRMDDSEIDLATAALIISEQWSDMVQGRRYLSRLDEMAEEIHYRLAEKGLEKSYKAIAVINEYLFDELGFKSVSEASEAKDLFLHSVMDRKRGYCLSLSVLYLSLGERLGLPLCGVVVPGHFFVRYDDGKVRFNIETTSRGGNAPDKHYMDKYEIPDYEDNLYMKNLNKLQSLGCFFNNLGNVYSDIGDYEYALEALELAVKINPSLAESRTNLGNVYLREERIAEAIEQYRAAIKINPKDSRSHNNLGNAYMRKDWYRDAIYKYERALKLDPKFVEAHINLANAFCKQELFGRAISQLRQAIGADSDNAGLYRQLGDVYGEKGNYKMAISQYKKSLQIKPDMVAALFSLGNVYFGREQYDEAIEQYLKAVDITAANSLLHYNLGAAYSNKKDYEKAASEYLRAIEIDPKMGSAHRGAAYCFYELGEYALADEHLKKAEQLGEDVPKDLRDAIESNLR